MPATSGHDLQSSKLTPNLCESGQSERHRRRRDHPLKLTDLTLREQDAIPRLLSFWLSEWDWECPTLFGLERNELEAIATAWPESIVTMQKQTALAVHGSLRELLVGASAVAPDKVAPACGLTHAELSALADTLRDRLENALDSNEAYG